MKYKRILLKLSGESLMGELDYGISQDQLVAYAEEIKDVVGLGVEVVIVPGGGNWIRGADFAGEGIELTTAVIIYEDTCPLTQSEIPDPRSQIQLSTLSY